LLRRCIAIAAAAAVALTAAACGSSSSSSDSPSTATTGSGTPIKLMQIVSPGDFGDGDLSLGAKAAVDALNASGGVDGHKLQLTECNAGSPPVGDPDSVSQCGTEAASDGVIAFVGDFIAYDSQLFAASQAADIPDIQPAALSPVDFTSPRSFPTGGGSSTILAGLGEMLAKDGCKAIADVDISSGANLNSYSEAIRAGVLYGGAKYLGVVGFSQNQADFAPVVQSVISKGADCIALPDGLNYTAFMRAAQTSGKSLIVGTSEPNLSPASIKQLGSLGNGLLGSDIQVLSSPTITKIEQEFAKYTPQAGVSGLEEGNWQSVELVADAASAVEKAGKSLTAANLITALGQVSNFGDGVAAPFNFSHAGPLPGEPRLTDGIIYGDQLEHGQWQPWPPIKQASVFAALEKYDH
jgi:branched-chain amino acid transport system substrate-binding protein